MDVSDMNSPFDESMNESSGQALLDSIAALSGLPQDLVQAELCAILEQSGKSVTHLTLDELRGALAVYLESFQADLQSDL